MKVEKVPDSTYDMVGGLDKQVKEIKEVVELPIKHPELFEALGVAQPKVGKRASCQQHAPWSSWRCAGCTAVWAAGDWQNFAGARRRTPYGLYFYPGVGRRTGAEIYRRRFTYGVSAGNNLCAFDLPWGFTQVRELFVMAREHAPSIIFMDEVDSIGSSRIDGGSGGGDSEVQRTMLELLNQLDGFEASNEIKVVMATNRIDILDSALLRPGRIDRKIEFPHPNEGARLDILKIHSRKMNLVNRNNLSYLGVMPAADVIVDG